MKKRILSIMALALFSLNSMFATEVTVTMNAKSKLITKLY